MLGFVNCFFSFFPLHCQFGLYSTYFKYLFYVFCLSSIILDFQDHVKRNKILLKHMKKHFYPKLYHCSIEYKILKWIADFVTFHTQQSLLIVFDLTTLRHSPKDSFNYILFPVPCHKLYVTVLGQEAVLQWLPFVAAFHICLLFVVLQSISYF